MRSSLPIPELPPWPGGVDGAQPADIVLTEGAVPEDLPDEIGLNGFVRVGRDGTVLLKLSDDLRFLVKDGREVTVELCSDVGRQSWRLYFLGTVIQYVCHQRGAYPLHAASLRIGPKVVAIAGHRGDGKSTLAFELARRGHRMLSDDLTVLQARDGEIQVFPAFPRLRLWRETLDAAGVSAEGLSRVRPDMEKFNLQPGEGYDPTPTRLDAVVVIAGHPDLELKRCSLTEAVPLLIPYVCRPKVARLLGRKPDLFRFTGAIAAQAPVYHLRRPKRFDQLADVAAAVERLCQ